MKEGADTAHLTANALAQHFRPGQAQVPNAPHFLAGATYDVQAMKEADGQWKIKTWILKVIWAEGSREVMQG